MASQNFVSSLYSNNFVSLFSISKDANMIKTKFENRNIKTKNYKDQINIKTKNWRSQNIQLVVFCFLINNKDCFFFSKQNIQ